MKPSELKSLLTARFKAGIKRPVHIEGSPGLGKTQIPGQVAKELGIGFMLIHGPLTQPEDIGFPVINKERTDVEFIVSSKKFPIVGNDAIPETGFLVIDEIAACDNNIQKAFTHLIQEREIHGQRIKPGWLIITTGNRSTDRAGANKLLTHLGNRVCRVTLEASIDDFSAWALNNGVAVEVISFVRFRPDLLSAFNPQNDVSATPRAWVEGVSASLGHIDPSLEFEVFKGDVGEGPAAEFLGFLKIYRKLPSPDAIILNPTSAEVPTDAATQYAICGALAHKTTPENFGRIVSYVNRIKNAAGELLPEFGMLYVRDCIKRNAEIQNSTDFIKWSCGSGSKLF